jgi:hypothetical protein
LTRANPPPRGCIIDRLLSVDGDNWARWVLLEHPGLLAHVRWQAKGCNACTNKLNRLFPEGIPEVQRIAGYTPEELEEVLRQLREETGKDIDTS